MVFFPSERSQGLEALIRAKLSSQILSTKVDLGDLVVTVSRQAHADFFKLLRYDTELHFDGLLSVTAIDWMDKCADRFEVVYHLMSYANKFNRIRVKVAVPESDAQLPSLVPLYASANFMEREVWDMYGVKFSGHPDLRRILLYDEFEGFPLRKDFPVQGKQPRIPLRAPEVHNTARNMIRPDLVQINAKKKEQFAVPGNASFEQVKYER